MRTISSEGFTPSPIHCPNCDNPNYEIGFMCGECGYIEDRPLDELDHPHNEPGAPFQSGDY